MQLSSPAIPPDARFHLTCPHEIDPDGDVVLVLPPPQGFWARLTRGSRPQRIQLEKLGSAVVKLCLAGVPFGQLPAELEILFPGQADLPRRTELFVRHLLQRGFLVMEKKPQ